MLTPFVPGPFHCKTGFVPTPHDFPKDCCIHAGTATDAPAPYFRKTFSVEQGLQKAILRICGQGFYEATCNGVNVTKGPLSPYRSDPDHILYMDEYDVTEHLTEGKNALGVLLGNGIVCSVFPHARYNKAPWRRAPFLAFRLTLTYAERETVILSDESVKTAPSPTMFNDLFLGERYDARLEQPGWDTADFDDSLWQQAKACHTPRGEARICQADPIGYFEELGPISITPFEDGYIYDFGVDYTGLTRLCMEGTAGQTVELRHFESLLDGKPHWAGIDPKGMGLQTDAYTCKGGSEVWMPKFCYHGFRYVLVRGITAQQAQKSLLTYVVMHADMPNVGTFSCDNEMVNALQACTLRADFSNIFHFPTDCPHREKMGWTGDAACSCEQMLYNFDPTKTFTEWLRNIHKAMTVEGRLPGIIPSAGTTYIWGNGPAWDKAMVELPWQLCRLRGETTAVEEAVLPLMRYLTYLTTRRQENGLIAYGLGDWCDVSQPEIYCSTPLLVTDSIMALDIARKAEDIFRFAKQPVFAKFAREFADSMLSDIRRELVDHENLMVYGDTQAGQALALYYGIFTEEEFAGAFRHLLELIHKADDHFACGILGARVMFRLLAEHGEADLALKMIIREDGPSYGAAVVRGVTALYEEYADAVPPRGDENHHMWGDISAWFYRYLAGIRPNDGNEAPDRMDIAPCFVQEVNRVDAQYRMPCGTVSVGLQKDSTKAVLTLSVPTAAKGRILAPVGWQFADGMGEKPLQSGEYILQPV